MNEDPKPKQKRVSAATKAYTGIKELLFSYEIRPGEKVAEADIAARFGISRTPVREALNRLVMEQLMEFAPDQGFFRPAISEQEIFDLYEMRVILETEAVRLGTHRASDEEIEALIAYWEGWASQRPKSGAQMQRAQLIEEDEALHEQVAALSHNKELVEALRRVNARIHFIRWAPSRDDAEHTAGFEKHLEFLRVLRLRDEEHSVAALRGIIERRREDLLNILKEGVAHLYIR